MQSQTKKISWRCQHSTKNLSAYSYLQNIIISYRIRVALLRAASS